VIRALGGEMVLRSASGDRVVESAHFFQGFMSTAIGVDEMLVEVRLPVAEPNAGWAFKEFSLRQGDFALAGIAAMVVADDDRCVSARIAACAVGDVPLRLGEAEEMLRESGLGSRNIEDAAKCAAEYIRPADDIHATAEYRRRLVRVLTRRAIVRAAECSRAIGS
jgi:aerobic carbon-monoxide dehydrogenase medium subunit